MKTDSGRNYGIDLLRMIAMYMVIILHLLSAGKVIPSMTVLSAKYVTAWSLEMASFGAVNLFAITSGYVHYGRKTNYASLIQLCLQVYFYTVLSTIAFYLLLPDRVNKRTILDALLPYRIESYWYFTSYICMFFFIPYINWMIDSLDRKSAFRLLSTCFVVFCLLTTVLLYDIGTLNRGYSCLWLMVMYVFGACLKKYDVSVKLSRCLLGYLLCVALSLAGKTAIEAVTFKLHGKAEYGDLFACYTSPFLVLGSVSLFLLFKNLSLRSISVNIVKFFAPATFGVYIIHMEPLIKDLLFTDRFISYASFPAPLMVCCVLGTALAIWLICAMTDKLRLAVFKAVKIPLLCKSVENKMKNFIKSYSDKLARM